MAFVAWQRLKCAECDGWIEIGQVASFAYNRYHHVFCPDETADVSAGMIQIKPESEDQ